MPFATSAAWQAVAAGLGYALDSEGKLQTFSGGDAFLEAEHLKT